jgi:hypothetical protein
MNGDVVGPKVGHSEVQPAVPIEVPERHRDGTGPGRRRQRWAKSTRTGAEHHRNLIGRNVRGSEIDVAVSVDVPRDDALRADPDGNRHGGKAAKPVANEDRNVVRARVSDGQVQVAVSIDIRDGHALRVDPRWNWRPYCKAADPIPQQD